MKKFLLSFLILSNVFAGSIYSRDKSEYVKKQSLSAECLDAECSKYKIIESFQYIREFDDETDEDLKHQEEIILTKEEVIEAFDNVYESFKNEEKIDFVDNCVNYNPATCIAVPFGPLVNMRIRAVAKSRAKKVKKAKKLILDTASTKSMKVNIKVYEYLQEEFFLRR